MDKLVLREPDQEEFRYWFEISTLTQAEDRAFANRSEILEERSILESQIKHLLPEGMLTSGHYFRIADQAQPNQGFIWMGILSDLKSDEIFLYDIIVKPEFRGKGLGRTILKKMEDEMKEKGYKKIYLYVMERNFAKKLYLSLGYETLQQTEMHSLMSKKL